MLRFLIILTICLSSFNAKADNSKLYERLDSVIANRAEYEANKEKRLHEIEFGINYVTQVSDLELAIKFIA